MGPIVQGPTGPSTKRAILVERFFTFSPHRQPLREDCAILFTAMLFFVRRHDPVPLNVNRTT